MYKNYYIEGDRIVSKIGGGMKNNITPLDNHIYAFDLQSLTDYYTKSDTNNQMMYRFFDSCLVNYDVFVSEDFDWLNDCANNNSTEKDIYFYHKDHLGSSTQITDKDANVIHQIEYMPTGEMLAEQRDNWGTSYKFNSKELDLETGLYYYGARYYNPNLSIWVSVDQLSDDYPHQSPFMFCSGNPVMRVDMDGMEDGWYIDTEGKIIGKDKKNDNIIYLLYKSQDVKKVQSDNFQNGIDQSSLNDPVEVPTYFERQKLGLLYERGLTYKSSELALLICGTSNGDLHGWFYKSKIESKTDVNGIKQSGSLDFNDRSKSELTDQFGPWVAADENRRVKAHLHNVSDEVSPPTIGGDKHNGFPIGIVFDYAKSGHNTYIHNNSTKNRSKSRMSTFIFLSPFITPDGKKL